MKLAPLTVASTRQLDAPSPGTSPTVHVRSHHARWWVQSAWRAQLFDADHWRFDQWQQAGAVRTIKAGHERVVFRVDLPDQSLVVKRYRSGIVRNWWNRIWRRRASEREWRMARELSRRGVATVSAVAWGESRRQGLTCEQYFVSEALPNAVTLNDYLLQHLSLLPAQLRTRVRRGLLRDVARRIAQAHRAGIAHNDLHLGNLLLRVAEDGTPAKDVAGMIDLRLIDLPGTHVGRSLAWRASRRNLRMLASASREHVTPREQARFWIAYLRARPDLSLDRRAAGRQLLSAAHRWSQRIVRSRERRSLRENREFQHVEAPSGRAMAVRTIDPLVLHDILAHPAAPLVRGLDEPQKLSHTSVVVRTSLAAQDSSRQVAWTRLRWVGWHKRLLGLARPSRARRRWRWGHALALRGISTARPLVCLEPSAARWRGESYLACEWLEGALDVHRWCWQLGRQREDVQHRHLVPAARAVGQLVGRLHWWRLGHRDLKGNNLLLSGDGASLVAYLIDLDGLTRKRWFPRRTRARHVARLAASLQLHPAVSRTHRLRGLKAYLQGSGQTPQDWKWWWRQIALALHRRRRRHVPPHRPQA